MSFAVYPRGLGLVFTGESLVKTLGVFNRDILVNLSENNAQRRLGPHQHRRMRDVETNPIFLQGSASRHHLFIPYTYTHRNWYLLPYLTARSLCKVFFFYNQLLRYHCIIIPIRTSLTQTRIKPPAEEIKFVPFVFSVSDHNYPVHFRRLHLVSQITVIRIKGQLKICQNF